MACFQGFVRSAREKQNGIREAMLKPNARIKFPGSETELLTWDIYDEAEEQT